MWAIDMSMKKASKTQKLMIRHIKIEHNETLDIPSLTISQQQGHVLVKADQ